MYVVWFAGMARDRFIVLIGLCVWDLLCGLVLRGGGHQLCRSGVPYGSPSSGVFLTMSDRIGRRRSVCVLVCTNVCVLLRVCCGVYVCIRFNI
jgi:hypothetical protein